MHGGSGDDKVVAGYTFGETRLYGNSGSDIIRSDQYDGFFGLPRSLCAFADDPDSCEPAEYEEYLFGDFKYGSDSLDKDLWGDDDRIYGRNLDCYE